MATRPTAMVPFSRRAETEDTHAFADYVWGSLAGDAEHIDDADKAVRKVYDDLNITPETCGLSFKDFERIVLAETAPTDRLLAHLRAHPSIRNSQHLDVAARRTQSAFGVTDEAAKTKRVAALLTKELSIRGLRRATVSVALGVMPELVDGLLDGSIIPDTALIGAIHDKFGIDKMRMVDMARLDRQELRSPVREKEVQVLTGHRFSTEPERNNHHFGQLLIRLTRGDNKDVAETLSQASRDFVEAVIKDGDHIHPYEADKVNRLITDLGLTGGAANMVRALGCGVTFKTVLDESIDCGAITWQQFTERLKLRMRMGTQKELAEVLKVEPFVVMSWLDGRVFGERTTQANLGSRESLDHLEQEFNLSAQQRGTLWFLASGRDIYKTVSQEQLMRDARERLASIDTKHANGGDKFEAIDQKKRLGRDLFIALMDRSGYGLQKMTDLSGVGYDAIHLLREPDRTQSITPDNAHRFSKVFFPAGSQQQKDLAMLMMGYSGFRTRQEWKEAIVEGRVTMGEMIREMREATNLSVNEFCERNGHIPRRTVLGWEEGKIKRIETEEYVDAVCDLARFSGEDRAMLARFLKGLPPIIPDNDLLLQQAQRQEITFGNMLDQMIKGLGKTPREFGDCVPIEGRKGRKGISVDAVRDILDHGASVATIKKARAIAKAVGIEGDKQDSFVVLAMGRLGKFPLDVLPTLAEKITGEGVSSEERCKALDLLIKSQDLGYDAVLADIHDGRCNLPERKWDRIRKGEPIEAPFIEPLIRTLAVPKEQQAMFRGIFAGPEIAQDSAVARINRGGGSDLPDR